MSCKPVEGRLIRDSTVALFCCLDAFAKLLEEREAHHRIPSGGQHRREMLFILVLFPIAPYKDFQHVWRYGLRHKDQDCFAELPNGSRFVSLPPRPLLPCSLLLHSFRGPTTGIHVADSTKLAICHNGRISRNWVLRGRPKRGRSTMGWFFGFKLHLPIHHKGRLLVFRITGSSKDERKPLEALTAARHGKVLGDQGQLSKSLPERLWQRGLHLMTGIRPSRKNDLTSRREKVVLRKRCIIETLFDKRKSTMGLEHSRRRSPVNALVHVLSCLAAYTLAEPRVNIASSGPIPIPNISSHPSPYPKLGFSRSLLQGI